MSPIRIALHSVLTPMNAVLAVAALTLAGVVPPALADYPDHVIKAVVPFPAGGGTDLFARIVAPPLAKALGRFARPATVISESPNEESHQAIRRILSRSGKRAVRS